MYKFVQTFKVRFMFFLNKAQMMKRKADEIDDFARDLLDLGPRNVQDLATQDFYHL